MRKSPKRGDIWSLFDELVRAPGLIAAPNVAVEALIVRNSVVSHPRRLRFLAAPRRPHRGPPPRRILLDPARDAQRLARAHPPRSGAPWSSAALGEAVGIPDFRARKFLYSLCRAGLLEESGKDGRRKLYVASRRSRKSTPGRA